MILILQIVQQIPSHCEGLNTTKGGAYIKNVNVDVLGVSVVVFRLSITQQFIYSKFKCLEVFVQITNMHWTSKSSTVCGTALGSRHSDASCSH